MARQMACFLKGLLLLVLIQMSNIQFVNGTIPNCVVKTADIGFIVDSSGSVAANDFQKELRFVSTIAGEYTIGPNDVQIGLIRFSSTSSVQFDFDDHTRKGPLTSAIRSTPRITGGTATHLALDMAKTGLFQLPAGMRTSAPNVLIVLTDGESTSPSLTATAASALHGMGIAVFAIGIDNANMAELEAIASNSNFVFDVDTFDALSTIVTALNDEICEVVMTMTTTPPTTAPPTTAPPTTAPACTCGPYVPTNTGCVGVCGVGTQEMVSNCTGTACVDPQKFRTTACNLPNKCVQTVNGGWSPWSSWTSCHSTCGYAHSNGKRERTRTCTNPFPSYGGHHCVGPDRETESCVPHHSTCVVPIHGGYADWKQWGSCTATCGSHGVRERQRECNKPPPSHGGDHCMGADRELGACLGVKACPGGAGSGHGFGNGGPKRRRARRPRRERRARRTRRKPLGGGFRGRSHHSRRNRGGTAHGRGGRHGSRGGGRPGDRFGGSGRSGGRGRSGGKGRPHYGRG